MYQLLDIALTWLHLVVIVFNLFGWIWSKTRKLHLIVAFITLFSWVLLGFKYGLGYCFLTDWQWQVKRQLGESNLPASFITYFLKRYVNIEPTPATVDLITGISFGLVVVLAVFLFFRSRIKRG